MFNMSSNTYTKESYSECLAFLGLPENPTKEEIKKSYHKKVLVYHPDKGGNPNDFIKLQKSYEFLIETFDLMNELGSKFNNVPPLSKVKTNSNNVNNNNEKHRTKDITYQIEISLKDAYFGKTKPITLKRNRICLLCKGSGIGDMIKQEKCSFCSAKGSVTKNNLKCTVCNGNKFNLKNECPECKGKKVTLQSKIITLIIEKGIYSGCSIIFENESEEYPGSVPGNVIFAFNVKEDQRFHKIGNNLFLEHSINLIDCLNGDDVIIEHFGNKKLRVTNIKEVIKPGMIKIIKGKGMPVYKEAGKYGDLFVKFNIIFPNKFSEINEIFMKKTCDKEKDKKNFGRVTKDIKNKGNQFTSFGNGNHNRKTISKENYETVTFLNYQT